MYVSGSEFHNNLLAMSGIFETKKWFQKDDKRIGRNRKQIFFLEQKLNFLVFNQT